MTLPKFIVRGDNTQKEQQVESKKMKPDQGLKHVDLLKDRFLEPKEVSSEYPQSRRPIADGSEVHEDEEIGEKE